jgi:hypothetical protein
MFRFCLVNAVVAIFLWTEPTQAQQLTKQELAETIRREGEWYLQELRNYQFEDESVSHYDGQLLNRMHFRSRQNGACYLTQNTITKPDGVAESTVVCTNGSYAFQLRRSGDKDWVLVKFHAVADGPLPDVFHLGGLSDPAVRLASPYMLQGLAWLPDMFSTNTFQVRKIDRQGVNETARVTLQYEFPDRTRPDMVQKGTVTLDPSRHWVITAFENNQIFKGTTKKTVVTSHFETGETGLPLRVRYTAVVSSDAPAFVGKNRTDEGKTTYTREVADESEFTLSAFGLPEPGGAKVEKRTPRYVWAIGIAVGFLILSVLFRWLARRRNVAPIQEGAAR